VIGLLWVSVKEPRQLIPRFCSMCGPRPCRPLLPGLHCIFRVYLSLVFVHKGNNHSWRVEVLGFHNLSAGVIFFYPISRCFWLGFSFWPSFCQLRVTKGDHMSRGRCFPCLLRTMSPVPLDKRQLSRVLALTPDDRSGPGRALSPLSL